MVTHAQLAAQLVVEGCLPMIQDKVQGKLPIEGRLLTESEKRDRGMIDALSVPGQMMSHTILYPIAPEGVFLDLDRSQASVWFANTDADKALNLLDAGLKKNYPQVQQAEDMAHPDARGMRVRLYKVQLDPALLASLEVSYPAPGGGAKQFVVRVRAQIKKDVHDKIVSDFLASQNTKKH